MSRVVLDASAVIAVLDREPGAGAVERQLDDAVMSSVNYGEVVSKYASDGLDAGRVHRLLQVLDIEIVPLDVQMAFETGMLRAPGRLRSLSFGDRACLALGRALGLPVLTADSGWLGLGIGVEVALIR